jgi:hypothetical protein
METDQSLNPTSFDISLLSQAVSCIKDWDLSTLEGEGAYIKTPSASHYGHVKLRLTSAKDHSCSPEIIWAISKTQLPPWYRKGINEVCEYFLSQLTAIRGKDHCFKVEVVDASYHRVDSKDIDLVMATVYAITNCFNKDVFPISSISRRRIDQCRESAMKLPPPY